MRRTMDSHASGPHFIGGSWGAVNLWKFIIQFISFFYDTLMSRNLSVPHSDGIPSCCFTSPPAPWSSLLGNHQIPANQRHEAKHLSGEVAFESVPSRLQITFNVLVQGHLSTFSLQMKWNPKSFWCACLAHPSFTYTLSRITPQKVFVLCYLLDSKASPPASLSAKRTSIKTRNLPPTQGWWVASIIIGNSLPAQRHLDARLLQRLVHLAHTLS